MKFLSLITRYLNEPFLEEFVEYYFSEGVDHIFIIYDTDSTIPINQNVKDNLKTTILESNNFKKRQTLDVNNIYTNIRNHFKWVIFVDCDEFITSTSHNITIRKELSTRYQSIDCIKIPWVMMSSGNIENDPPSILQYLTTRWDHDKRHNHPNNWNKGRCRYSEIEVKSIVKCDMFNNLGLHHPNNPVKNYSCIDSIKNVKSDLGPFYYNLRENDIENATLLCYHYRIFSKESAKRKFRNNKLDGYKAGSLHNLLLSDHSEKTDEFMKNKSIAIFGRKK
jgi:hypothetical protein